MPLDNVPRIAAPSPEELFRDYIVPRRPVVITNLFDRAPIRAIDTVAKARERLGGIDLEIQPNYLVFLEGRRGDRRRMPLAAYLDHVAADPRTKDVCVEFTTPPDLAEVFPMTAYATHRAPADMVSATFLANAGNFAHLHFDTDLRDVLLYQAFGEKRFALIPPEQNRKLDAFMTFDPATRKGLVNVPGYEGNGRQFLHEIPTPELRDRFLEYVGAHDVVLRAGETLFMPALVWHYVEYTTTSLSITHRLGRGPVLRSLGALFPYPSTFLQTVGAYLSDESRFAKEHPDLFGALTQALMASYANDDAKANAVNDVVLQIFERLTGDRAAAVAAAREMHRQAVIRS